jgi:hypothetical protein
MATLKAMASNLFETIGLVPPCIEVMVREATECPVELKPLHMQWVRERKSDGRTVTRVQWVEDAPRKDAASAAHSQSPRKAPGHGEKTLLATCRKRSYV